MAHYVAILSLLEMTPSLESIRIESHFIPLLGDPGDKVVDLPHLRYVDLSWSSASIVAPCSESQFGGPMVLGVCCRRFVPIIN